MPQDKRLWHTTIIPCEPPHFNMGLWYYCCIVIIMVLLLYLLSCGIYHPSLSAFILIKMFYTCFTGFSLHLKCNLEANATACYSLTLFQLHSLYRSMYDVTVLLGCLLETKTPFFAKFLVLLLLH